MATTSTSGYRDSSLPVDEDDPSSSTEIADTETIIQVVTYFDEDLSEQSEYASHYDNAADHLTNSEVETDSRSTDQRQVDEVINEVKSENCSDTDVDKVTKVITLENSSDSELNYYCVRRQFPSSGHLTIMDKVKLQSERSTTRKRKFCDKNRKVKQKKARMEELKISIELFSKGRFGVKRRKADTCSKNRRKGTKQIKKYSDKDTIEKEDGSQSCKSLNPVTKSPESNRRMENNKKLKQKLLPASWKKDTVSTNITKRTKNVRRVMKRKKDIVSTNIQNRNENVTRDMKKKQDIVSTKIQKRNKSLKIAGKRKKDVVSSTTKNVKRVRKGRKRKHAVPMDSLSSDDIDSSDTTLRITRHAFKKLNSKANCDNPCDLKQISRGEETKTPGMFFMCGSKCGYSTLYKDEFEKHIVECSFSGSMSCYHCSSNGCTVQGLTEHLDSHCDQTSDLYACVHCKDTTSSKTIFFDHVQFVCNRDEGGYVCMKCQKSFATFTDLKKHVEDNLLLVVWCRFCPAMSCSVEVMQEHVEMSHSNIKQLSKARSFWTMEELVCQQRMKNLHPQGHGYRPQGHGNGKLQEDKHKQDDSFENRASFTYQNGDQTQEKVKVIQKHVERSHSSKGKSPSSNKRSYASNNKSPSSNGKSHSSNGKSPSINIKSHSSNEKTPSSNEMSPSSNIKSHSRNEKSPSSNIKSHSSNEKSPSSNAKSHSNNKKLYASNDKSPSSNAKSPSSNRMLGSCNEKSPTSNKRVRPSNENSRSHNEKSGISNEKSFTNNNKNSKNRKSSTSNEKSLSSNNKSPSSNKTTEELLCMNKYYGLNGYNRQGHGYNPQGHRLQNGYSPHGFQNAYDSHVLQNVYNHNGLQNGYNPYGLQNRYNPYGPQNGYTPKGLGFQYGYGHHGHHHGYNPHGFQNGYNPQGHGFQNRVTPQCQGLQNRYKYHRLQNGYKPPGQGLQKGYKPQGDGLKNGYTSQGHGFSKKSKHQDDRFHNRAILKTDVDKNGRKTQETGFQNCRISSSPMLNSSESRQKDYEKRIFENKKKKNKNHRRPSWNTDRIERRQSEGLTEIPAEDKHEESEKSSENELQSRNKILCKTCNYTNLKSNKILKVVCTRLTRSELDSWSRQSSQQEIPMILGTAKESVNLPAFKYLLASDKQEETASCKKTANSKETASCKKTANSKETASCEETVTRTSHHPTAADDQDDVEERAQQDTIILGTAKEHADLPAFKDLLDSFDEQEMQEETVSCKENITQMSDHLDNLDYVEQAQDADQTVQMEVPEEEVDQDLTLYLDVSESDSLVFEDKLLANETVDGVQLLSEASYCIIIDKETPIVSNDTDCIIIDEEKIGGSCSSEMKVNRSIVSKDNDCVIIEEYIGQPCASEVKENTSNDFLCEEDSRDSYETLSFDTSEILKIQMKMGEADLDRCRDIQSSLGKNCDPSEIRKIQENRAPCRDVHLEAAESDLDDAASCDSYETLKFEPSEILKIQGKAGADVLDQYDSYKGRKFELSEILKIQGKAGAVVLNQSRDRLQSDLSEETRDSYKTKKFDPSKILKIQEKPEAAEVGSFLDREVVWLYQNHGSFYVCNMCYRVMDDKFVMLAHVVDHLKVSFGRCDICKDNLCSQLNHQDHTTWKSPVEITDDIRKKVAALLGKISMKPGVGMSASTRFMKTTSSEPVLAHSEHSGNSCVEGKPSKQKYLRKHNDISGNQQSLSTPGPKENVPRHSFEGLLKPVLGSHNLNEQLKDFTSCLVERSIPVFICRMCNSTYASLYSLHRHILVRHLETALFSCPVCCYGDCERYSVARHIRDEHPQDDVCVYYIPFRRPGKKYSHKNF